MADDLWLEYNMLPPGSRVLCAVSGGADSMCMLSILCSESAGLGIYVAAAHFEHGIRESESLRDLEFVRDFCSRNSIEFHEGHGNVPEYAAMNGMSVEEAARVMRYAFLSDTAKKYGFDRIATAHNADDNVETMLLNLTRGAGTRGLCGIPPVRDNIIRPILDMTRAEIENYLEANSVPHIEDSTNLSDDYSRNIIRHKVMPVLRGINPAVSGAAFRSCRLLRQDDAYLCQLAQSFLVQFPESEGIPVSNLIELPEPVFSRVIRAICPQTPAADHVSDVRRFIKGTGIGYLDIPGIRLTRANDRLYTSYKKSNPLPDREIVINSTTDIPEAGLHITAEVESYSDKVHNNLTTCFIRYESICGRLRCTSKKTGDRIAPMGRGCSKTLKALFQEHGIGADERIGCPVIRDDRGVLAVWPYAVDERCRVKPGDKAIRLTIEKY